jgi:hypothetical protein
MRGQCRTVCLLSACVFCMCVLLVLMLMPMLLAALLVVLLLLLLGVQLRLLLPLHRGRTQRRGQYRLPIS